MKAVEYLSKTHESFRCLALVKPRSEIASEWSLSKPVYCIFEFSKAFSEVTISFGDGSWQRLEKKEELDQLVLLEQFGDSEIDDIFD